jgi:hydrogenase maturation factor
MSAQVVRFRTGKVPQVLLQRLLTGLGRRDGRVLVGPGIGLDATVIDFGQTCLVAKTDPITFATQDIGWYAVQVNANDVACLGARPRWFMATVLLPEGQADEQMASEIFGQIESACAEMDVSLVGGHMEITYDLPRPIVVGHMLGEVQRDRILTAAGAKPGDCLVLTKGIPLEGASIIAREKKEYLVRKGHSRELLDRVADYLRQPGISVVREALLAAESRGVHALHDPTEGGLATALHEVAAAAGVGITVEENSIPLLSEAAPLWEEFGLDPLGTIASGSLLVSVSPEAAEGLVARIREAGPAAAIIGRVTSAADGVRIRRASGKEPLPRFDSDEIAKIFQEKEGN